MPRVVMNIGPGGEIRAIHSDGYDFMGVHGCPPPMRASHVEPIQTGPGAGRWYADMSPLGDGFGYCLWPPFATRAAALEAEAAHIERHWVRKEPRDDG